MLPAIGEYWERTMIAASGESLASLSNRLGAQRPAGPCCRVRNASPLWIV